MNGLARTAESNTLKRTLMMLAFVGTGLLGAALGGWFGGAPAGLGVGDRVASVAAQPTSARSSRAAAARLGSVPIASVALLLAATLLVFSSYLALRRLTAVPADAGVRDRSTGLYLPAYVTEAVRHLAARDDRNQRSQLALVQISIGFLDEVKRNYNAAAAAELVSYAGRLIRSQSREGDLPARAGDDGFAVYLHCEDREQAMAYCRRLSMLFAREQLEVRGDVFKVSASMGVAMRDCGESLDALRRRAADRLDEARAEGPASIAG